jgi:Polysaccharide deacetylase
MPSVVSTQACGNHPSANSHKRGGFEKRQATRYPTGPASDDVPPLARITPTPVSYGENTLPVIVTYTARGTPHSLLVSHRLCYNPLRCPPNHSSQTHIITNSFPQIPLFLQHGHTPPSDHPPILPNSKSDTIPNIPPNPNEVCADTLNAATFAAAGSSGHCWRTCGGCLGESDITQCKDQWEWGHTYDDGPGLYTNKLLTYLNTLAPITDIPSGVAPGVKATFFVVGARVISRPEIVVYEYMNNHEISIHTWSHTALMTLADEQVSLSLASLCHF